MKKINGIFPKEIIILLTVLFIVIVNFAVYKKYFEPKLVITARFQELGPLSKSMPVYYKGYNIGKTIDISPSEDYKYTLVKIALFPKKIALPINIIAKVKKLGIEQHYIELIYPEKPFAKFLTNDSIIEGKTTADLASFMEAQADSGKLFSIMADVSKTLGSFDKTGKESEKFFKELTNVLKENRQYIHDSAKNTSESLENINKTTKSLNDIIGDKKIKKDLREIISYSSQATKNVDKISGNINELTADKKLKATIENMNTSSENLKKAATNIENITRNIDNSTKNLDKTMEKIDSTITETQAAASNINGITKGVQSLLCKRFAGIRIFFGKTSTCNSCNNNKQ
jgi:ABC-type transporter Mla subunit MlaD